MCGAEKYTCRKCGMDYCSKVHPAMWMTPVPGKHRNGNVCPLCVMIFNWLQEVQREGERGGGKHSRSFHIVGTTG